MLLVIITFIWVIIASITDLKKREVPDWISYSLIAIGVVFSLINAIVEGDFFLLINPLIGFIVFFIIANLMYHSSQWGGGDAKLLMGFGIVFSSYPNSLLNVLNPYLGSMPFPIIFLLNIIIFGSVYGILWALMIALKNKEKSVIEFKRILSKSKKSRYLITTITLILLILSFIVSKDLKILFVGFGAMIFILFYLSLFVKAVENSAMVKKLAVDKLTEGDWVLNKIFINKKLVYSPRASGITKEDIIRLKKYGKEIREVVVKEGIPFVPSFLISIIVSLIFGSVIRFG